MLEVVAQEEQEIQEQEEQTEAIRNLPLFLLVVEVEVGCLAQKVGLLQQQLVVLVAALDGILLQEQQAIHHLEVLHKETLVGVPETQNKMVVVVAVRVLLVLRLWLLLEVLEVLVYLIQLPV